MKSILKASNYSQSYNENCVCRPCSPYASSHNFHHINLSMPALDDAKASQTYSDGNDTLFERFEQPNFDPIQYLNDILPAITLTSQPSTNAKQSRTALLQTTSTETQTILSKINTHSVRSSSELTGLTDEILRSGNRLAYEVEVLRSDANSFYDLLTDALKDDIAQFVTEYAESAGEVNTDISGQIEGSAPAGKDVKTDRDPEFIRQLRSLGLMKARLEAVINVFGEALKWPIPPSDVSMATLISASAPELGVANSAEDDRAREYTRQLRNEITLLLDSDGGSYAGLDAATKKVDEFKSLAEVWKGTAEEKARTRVVESLMKIIDDRKRLLDARSAPSRPSTENTIRSNLPGRAGRIVEGSSNTAAGFFRKLRDDIYLE